MYEAIEIVTKMYGEAIHEYEKFPVRSIASAQAMARIDALGDVIIALRRASLGIKERDDD